MKKLFYLIGCLCLTAGFVACKKTPQNYSCHCTAVMTADTISYSTIQDYTYSTLTREEAESSCNSNESTVTTNGVTATITCDLK